MNKSGYVVFDFYEGVEKLGKVDTLAQAEELENERCSDTDGECDVRIYDLDNLDDMIEFVNDMTKALGL